MRHPMPYGDLVAQKVQRYAAHRGSETVKCTVEEMEEYEPHIVEGHHHLRRASTTRPSCAQAEKEADVIVWDGGNNDMSFYKPDLTITVVDPHRPGHELTLLSGRDERTPGRRGHRQQGRLGDERERRYWCAGTSAASTRRRSIIEAASPIVVDDPALIRGKRVLVVEDGPTLTHGGMRYGAGMIAAKQFGASELVDPRPYAVRSIKETFQKYPDIGTLLPAMGYGTKQVRDLEDTINQVPCDTVVIGTPIDLRRIVSINKPSVRVQYSLAETGKPDLEDVLQEFIRKNSLARLRKR